MTDDNKSAPIFAHAIPEEALVNDSQRRYVPMFPYPFDHPMVFVKCGGPQKQAGGEMQMVAFNWVGSERQKSDWNIYVPEVYKIFTRNRQTFIIMQLVEGNSIGKISEKLKAQSWEGDVFRTYFDLVIKRVQLLRRMPLPVGLGGPIRHMIFNAYESAIEYGTVEELQDHLNRVARLGYHTNPDPPQITLEKELVFCYTDFNDQNFMFATDTDHYPQRLYIVDFGHNSFLPVSFLSCAVFEPESRWFLCRPIGERIGDSLPRDNLEVLQRICYMFQISKRRIGLGNK